jgi:hypothetical protein
MVGNDIARFLGHYHETVVFRTEYLSLLLEIHLYQFLPTFILPYVVNTFQLFPFKIFN